jgi:hypothetical protein
MKNLLTALVLSCAAFTTASFAADAPGASAPMGKQQSKMASCNKDAGDKKGDDRKAFMKSCLSAKKDAAPDAKAACDTKAADKKLAGAAKNSFVKKCVTDSAKA